MRPPRPLLRLPLAVAAACVPGWVAFAAAAEAGDAAPRGSYERDVLPVLERTCVRCHEGEDAEAGVDFSLYLDEDEALAAPELWQEVGWQLWKHTMPPPSRKKQPTAEERATVLRWIDETVALRVPVPAPTIPLRRLSNREYQRAVLDLSGVSFDANAFFAADPVLAGFDNQAGALSMSANRFEKHIDAAEKIARDAIHLPEPDEPPVKRYDGASLRNAPARGSLAALSSNRTVYGDFRAPRSGRYRLVVTAWGQQAGPQLCRMQVGRGTRKLQRFDVAATRDAPEDYVVEAELEEGLHEFTAAFTNDYYQPQAEDPTQRDRNLYIEGMRLEGPLDPLPPTALQLSLLDAHGEDVLAMVRAVAARAWRGSVTKREARELLALSEKDDLLEVRLRRALEGVLVSPRFLFRTDAVSGDANARAARLGFLLGGGLPDAALQARASAGGLDDEASVRSEVRRLLSSERGRTALAEDFATQWLQLRILDGVTPDPELFPEFDAELRDAMKQESLRLFDELLQQGLPLSELLTADSSWINARLATHYGVPWSGDGWAKADFSASSRRGLLGHASVLTMTSTPIRTSAVIRGKWLLEVLLDAPSPPPPPGTGSLDDPGVDTTLSQRAQLEVHRERAECAVCHDTLDPLGLSLENFGPLGRWREEAAGFAIDASAVLPDGRALEGPIALSDVLASDDQALARGLLRRFASYALGRPVGPQDRVWLQHALDSMDEGPPTLVGILEAVAVAIALFPGPEDAQ